jgi:hypothetical protein
VHSWLSIEFVGNAEEASASARTSLNCTMAAKMVSAAKKCFVVLMVNSD